MKSILKRRHPWTFLLTALLAGAPVLGQIPNTGVVNGQVRDQSGNPVASVQVFLMRSAATLITRLSSQTNANGFFRFEKVPPGEYELAAAARQTTVFPGTADAATAIVVASTFAPNLFGARGGPLPDSSYLPGKVEVGPDAVVENVNVTLAAAANDPSLRIIRGKIVVEDGGMPTTGMRQLSLFFSDGPDNQGANLTFIDRPSVAASTRLEARTMQSTLNLVNSFLPLPRITNGVFRFHVRDGVYRVLQQPPPAGVQAVQSPNTAYYVKGLSFGATDLMKDLMTVKAPIPNGPIQTELVITLARCTPASKDELPCR